MSVGFGSAPGKTWLSTPASFKYCAMVSATPNLNKPWSVTISAFFAPRFCAFVPISFAQPGPKRDTQGM